VLETAVQESKVLGLGVQQFSTTDNSTVVCVRHQCSNLVLERIKCMQQFSAL